MSSSVDQSEPQHSGAAAPLSKLRSVGRLLPAVAVTAAVLAVTLQFHDRFWCPADEGAYAYVADRILEGDVLNRDIQDVHLGLVNLANAAAMRVFGRSMLSLRYPLILMCVLETAMLLLLFRHRSFGVSIACGAVMAGLTFVQFLNPTAHWYCLCCVVCLIVVLTEVPRSAWWRIPLVGAIVGLTCMFRQLTGVFTAMAAVSWLLTETPADRSPSAHTGRLTLLPARTIAVVMTIGLSFYLFRRTTPLTLLLYGGAPLTLLITTIFRTRRTANEVLRMTAAGTTGAVLTLLPLVIYHLRHGSVSDWLTDTVFAAAALSELPWIGDISFPLLAELTVGLAAADPRPAVLLNAAFWLLALAAPVVLGVFVVRFWCTDGTRAAVTWCAVFYSLVSLHYQIPIYLFYSLGLCLIAIVRLFDEQPVVRRTAVSAVCTMSAVALVFHAGQPISRLLSGTLKGERVAQTATLIPDRGDLRVTQPEADIYSKAVGLIRRTTSSTDCILAVPVNPELYFLSGRPAAVRFFNTALDVHTAADLNRVTKRLGSKPPELVFYRPDDKYNTSWSRQLMRQIQATYEPLPPIGDFEVYRRRGDVLLSAAAE